MGVGESSVVVAVSSPHRPEAFDAARYAIDGLKAGDKVVLSDMTAWDSHDRLRLN
jgi:molybdopterin synthase catalytic subunit